jgi:hypothetical protein
LSSIRKFEINGVIDTNENVFSNIELLATSAGSFVTWDPARGHWAVIVNEPSNSVKTFNDSNIISSITVGGSGVNELYNTVELEFPHKDLRDAVDYVTVSLPLEDRFTNEVDNQLSIKLNAINDPVQARIIATQELKQNRMDKIIQFQTDFTANGIKAGDIITVNNAALTFTNKLFRIIQIGEEDTDEGAIIYSITALEYDADVYDISGLTYDYRTKNTGIISRIVNDEITISEGRNTGNELLRLLGANIIAGLFNTKSSGVLGNILKSIFGADTDENGNPVDENGNPIIPTDEAVKDKILGGVRQPTLSTIAGPNQVCEGTSVTIIVGHTCSSCLFDIPPIDYPYTITGVSAGDLNIPLTGSVTVTNGVGTLTFIPTVDGESEGTETATITIGGLTKTLQIFDQKDYTYSVARSAASITEGESVTITLTATGSKADASIPYAITGSATSRVASPALTGTVTTSGGTATLVIETIDDQVVQGAGGLTITFEPSLVDPCNTVGPRSTSVTVLDNDTPPEPPPPDIQCQYISVPMTWCGTFDGADFQLKSMTVLANINLPVPQAGEATITVPLTVSVAKGNPSNITVTSTATVAATALQSAMGGRNAQIITAFDSVPPKGLIKGTVLSVYGY